jgi:hypothetical protein
MGENARIFPHPPRPRRQQIALRTGASVPGLRIGLQSPRVTRRDFWIRPKKKAASFRLTNGQPGKVLIYKNTPSKMYEKVYHADEYRYR